MALLLASGLMVPGAASAAEDCEASFGHGWPPATENYGNAVESLLAGPVPPRLQLTRLPTRGTESSVALVQGPTGWRLRVAEADERVMDWNGTGDGVQRQLRIDQVPDVEEVPVPDVVVERLVAGWQRLFATLPADHAAPFSRDEQWTIVIDGMRVSGVLPDCDAGDALEEQVDLLVEAVGESASKRERRWQEVLALLDEMDGARLVAGGAD